MSSPLPGGGDDVNVRVLLDVAGVERGAQQASRAIKGVEGSADHLARQATQDFQKIRDDLGNIGVKAFAGGAAIAVGLGVATKAASDLNESASKSEVVFGQANEAVTKFAQDAARNLGISKQQAFEATATFGNLFRGIGFNRSAAADMSTKLVQLASDLASFNNQDPTQVLQDLRSGLVGEAEPLRKYGVLLNEASVQQEAMRETGKRNADQLTEGEKAAARYALILQQTTTAQGDFARTSSGLANSTRIAQASIKDAEAAIGTALLPAVAAGAQGIARLAGAIAELPPPLLKAGSEAAGAAAGILLIAGASAKTISAVGNTAATIRRLADNLRGAEQSATGFARVLGNVKVAAAGLGLGALAVTLVAVDHEIQRQQSDWESLGNAIADVGSKTADLRLQGSEETAAQVEHLQQVFRDLAFAIDQAAAPKIDENVFHVFGVALPTIEGIKDDLPFITTELDKLGATGKHAGEDLEKLSQLLSDPNVDAAKLLADVQAAEQRFLAGATPDIKGFVDAIDTMIAEREKYRKVTQEATTTEDDFSAKVDDAILKHRDAAEKTAIEAEAQAQLNREFIAGEEAQGRFVPDFVRNAKDAAAASAEWKTKTDDLITSFLTERGALVDLVPSIDGIQAPLAKVSDTAEGTALALNRVGQLRLSKANREALEYGRTLDHVEDALVRTDAAIQQNEGDLSMWQGRITLVTDVLGGNSEALNGLIDDLRNGRITQEQFNAAIEQGALGPLTRLDALLAEGKISQDQYNEAKAAGLHLIERSAGGIQDEDAELVQNLIDLDRYVRAHDDASGAVQRLTDRQREFLAATKSDSVQSFIQQFEALKALGVDQEHVTKFVIDSADADPVLKAWLEDVGILEGDHKVTLNANNANQVLDDLNGKVSYFLSLDGKTVTIVANSKADALEAAKRNADALDGKTVDVVINADDGPIRESLGQLQQDAGEPVTTPVQADTTDADKAIDTVKETAAEPVTVPVQIGPLPPLPGLVNPAGGGPGTTPETAQPVPQIVTPPADTTQTVKSLDDLIKTAGEKGLAAGDAAAVGIETGVSGAPGKIVDDVANVVAAVAAIQAAMYNAGFNAGYSVDAGLITGLAVLAPQVYAAAQTIADGVHQTMANALQIASPSRKAMRLTEDYIRGIVITFERDTSAVQASRTLGTRVGDAFQPAPRDLQLARALGGFDDLRQRNAFAQRTEPPLSPVFVDRGPAFHGDINVSVTGAAGDPDQIANRVRTEVVDGIHQLLSRRT